MSISLAFASNSGQSRAESKWWRGTPIFSLYSSPNMEVLSRTGQQRLQDIVAERRLRMAGHIIRMPPGRPANHAMSWTPRGSGRRRGRPTKTWRSTFKEDLVDRGVDWISVRAVATIRSRWRTLAVHCPVKDRRI